MVLQPYIQTTHFTTGASSLLVLLHHLKPEIELSKENEFDIWRHSANLPTRASSIFALATYACRHGLAPHVVVEDRRYLFPDYRFYRYSKTDIEQASFTSEQYLHEMLREGVPLEERNITIEEIKNHLQQKKLLLLRINTKPIRQEKRNTSHFIVLHNYLEKHFQLIDPAFGALSIPEDTFQEGFVSLKTKKHRDHRMIIF